MTILMMMPVTAAMTPSLFKEVGTSDQYFVQTNAAYIYIYIYLYIASFILSSSTNNTFEVSQFPLIINWSYI